MSRDLYDEFFQRSDGRFRTCTLNGIRQLL